MPSYLTQYANIAQSIAHSADRRADQIERIQAQLSFAHQLCAAHPDRAGEWQARILEAGHVVQDALKSPAVDLGDLTARAEVILAPIGETAKHHTSAPAPSGLV